MSSEPPRETADAPDRRRVSAPRADETREWEVFVRERPEEPLRHAGSVTAPSAAVAHEAAGTLFDHTAETVWCAPTDEVARFTTRDLGSEYTDETPTDEVSARERPEEPDDVESDEEEPV
jgi:rSAM-partnered protein